jgi:hypothetical protein
MSRYESAGLDGTGALQLRRISLLERGCIDAEEFSRRGRGSLAWHGRRVRCTAGYGADSGSASAVREVYLNPLISPSLPSFCSPVVQPASREIEYSQSLPRTRDGHSCLQTVYLRANSSALQERSTRPQTCAEASQHLRQAPADQAERYSTQHAAASGTGIGSS